MLLPPVLNERDPHVKGEEGKEETEQPTGDSVHTEQDPVCKKGKHISLVFAPDRFTQHFWSCSFDNNTSVLFFRCSVSILSFSKHFIYKFNYGLDVRVSISFRCRNFLLATYLETF
jgi:hypothetical protein